MKLTAENYHSPEASQAYLSVSQYKNFVGTLGKKGCEARAMAIIKGEWQDEMTTALLVGSYVDAHFEGTLDVFKAQHPEIVTKSGELKSEYKQANDIIARIERDAYFMKYMSGKKQVIFTGEIFGVEWKCKIDSLIPKVSITDLKVMKAIRDSFWVKDHGYMSFVEYWGYDIQASIYQRLTEINLKKKLPFFIAGASKEKFPDIEIIGFIQNDLDNVMSTIAPNIKRITELKAGTAVPDRCEGCDFCKHTKVLTKPIHFSELVLSI